MAVRRATGVFAHNASGRCQDLASWFAQLAMHASDAISTSGLAKKKGERLYLVSVAKAQTYVSPSNSLWLILANGARRLCRSMFARCRRLPDSSRSREEGTMVRPNARLQEIYQQESVAMNWSQRRPQMHATSVILSASGQGDHPKNSTWAPSLVFTSCYLTLPADSVLFFSSQPRRNKTACVGV
jgi:hypothetical protein